MLNEYIKKYGKGIYGLCFHLSMNKSDADDLYQETWIKIYSALNQYDSTRPFMTWASQICVNAYRDMLRKNPLERLIAFFSSDEEKQVVIDRMSVNDIYTIEEEYILKAIYELPEKYRMVLILHYYQELTTKEMAIILKIPEGTVKYRLVTACSKLKGRLNYV